LATKYLTSKEVKSILELASGSGVHVTFFAQNFPNVAFQPSEVDTKNIESIKAYTDHYKLAPFVREPIVIDLTQPDLCPNIAPVEMIYASNFTHISPISCTKGAFRIASKLLARDQTFLMYGPFSIDGQIFPESNQRFNEHLIAQNVQRGYRDTSLLDSIATENGFSFTERISMPSNNWIMVFKKA